MSDNGPGCGSPLAEKRPGCERWECGRLRDKNTGHVYETPNCLRRQLAAAFARIGTLEFELGCKIREAAQAAKE